MRIKTNFIAVALLGLASTLVTAQSPTVALPAATSNKVTLSWTNNCTTSAPCNIIPFRVQGQCSGLTVGSQVTQLAATAAQATTAADTTVSPNTTYSYVVEAQDVTTGAMSGPSNCVTVTTPNVPSVPTNLTGK